MQHLHDDALTLLALGEPATDEERAHLEDCLRCRADLGSFERVVTAARLAGAAQDDGETPPDPSVWENIHRELNLDESLREDPLAPAHRPKAPHAGQPAESTAPVTSLAGARRRRTSSWLAAAAAAVVVAAAGTWGAVRQVNEPGPEVVASVDLAPLAEYSDTGSAVVDQLPDGRRELVVRSSSSEARGYREVWLLAPDASSMVSVGIMEGTEGTFELPADLDLNQYPVVDISDEPDDGNPAHSGDSILRGQLDL